MLAIGNYLFPRGGKFFFEPSDKPYVDIYINPIVKACRDALSMWTGGLLEELPASEIDMDRVATIGVGGNPGLDFWVGASRDTLSALYEGAMGMPPDCDEEIDDILGELANQVLGPAVAVLPNASPSTLTIPVLTDEAPTAAVRTLRVGDFFFLMGVQLHNEAGEEDSASAA